MKVFSNPADFFERFGLVVLGVLIFLFFTLDPNTSQFASSANLKNILSNESLLGIIVVATVIPLVAGHIDLSVGPASALSSVLCAGMMGKAGWPLVPAMLVGIGAGVAVGVVNGVLIARVGINSIITTLGTSSIIGALILWYTAGESIVTGLSPKLTDIGSGQWLGLPKPCWFLIVIAAIVWYVLEHLPIGRYLYSVGSNPRAAELVGLRVHRMTQLSFLASGALAGIGGLLLVAIQGGGNPQLGPNYTLPALAAVFLGATAIKPGRYNVLGAIVAILLLAIAVNGLTLLGADPWVNDMFNGLALLVGVGVSVYSGRRRQSQPGQPIAGSSDGVATSDDEAMDAQAKAVS